MKQDSVTALPVSHRKCSQKHMLLFSCIASNHIISYFKVDEPKPGIALIAARNAAAQWFLVAFEQNGIPQPFSPSFLSSCSTDFQNIEVFPLNRQLSIMKRLDFYLFYSLLYLSTMSTSLEKGPDSYEKTQGFRCCDECKALRIKEM